MRVSRVAPLLELFLILIPSALGTNTAVAGQNFTSATYGLAGPPLGQSSCIVPDTMGTVGRDHIVQIINGLYTVFDKSDGSVVLLQSKTLDQFWIDAGVTPLGTDGSCTLSFDPRVVYDPFSERYFVVSADNGRRPNDFLLAASSTSSPLGDWSGFSIDSSSSSRWADYPMLGITHDSVTVGANMFPVFCLPPPFGSCPATETSILTGPKSDLIGPNPTSENFALFENRRSTTGLSPHPAVHWDHSNTPPTVWAGESDNVRRSLITGGPSSPSLGFPADISLDNLDHAPSGDQPGTQPNLDNLNPNNDRLSAYPVLQEEQYWGAQVRKDNATGNSAVRWFKIDQSTNAKTEGLIADTSLDFLYPSIAVNKFGDVVIGFTGTSENQSPSAYAVVGQTTSSGTTFGSVELLWEGDGSYVRLDSNSRNRWGDYSATVVDPVNPFHFWTFQEFVYDEDEWGIQITEIVVGVDELGDMDFDGDVDLDDVDEFIFALNDESGYYSTYEAQPFAHGDFDCDRDHDLDDVDGFVEELIGTYVPCAASSAGSGSFQSIPEPNGFILILTGCICAVAVVRYRGQTRWEL